MQGEQNRTLISKVVSVLLVCILIASCAPAAATPAPTAVPAPATAVPATAVPATAAAATAVPPTPIAGPTAAGATNSAVKFAMIIPGSISDADYNMLGYNATQDIGKKLGIASEYSEQVAVADAESVAKQYIARGFNVIAFHGGQYVAAVEDLAPLNPKVVFIAESGGPDPKLGSPNIWNIGRRVFMAQYAYGVLAARMTKTKKVAFLGGQKFSNFISSINTIDQAIAATDPSVKLIYTFTGDQNDAVKGRQGAQALMDQGADFLLINLNGGCFGAIDGIKASSTPVLFASLYTDKSSLAPQNFTSSPIYDFSTAFSYIITQVENGTDFGYYDMKPGNGIVLSPFYNVPDSVQQEVKTAWDAVGSGAIKLTEDTSAIKIRP
jgi:basic membrane protein A and related proteins